MRVEWGNCAKIAAAVVLKPPQAAVGFEADDLWVSIGVVVGQLKVLADDAIEAIGAEWRGCDRITHRIDMEESRDIVAKCEDFNIIVSIGGASAI